MPHGDNGWPPAKDWHEPVPPPTVDPRQRMISLLTERPEYRQAYLHNPEFRAAITAIVDTFPFILRAAYEAADEAEQKRRALYSRHLSAGWKV